MHLPILKSLLGTEALQQLTQFWPEKCCHAHGDIARLPEPLRDDILTSIAALTTDYEGHLNEIDPRKGYEMYPVADGTANTVIKSGATAYLEDISPLVNNMESFIAALENELKIEPGSAKPGAFISAAGSGAPTHYDVLDVISIQLVGSKKFYISPLEQIRYPYGMQYCEGTPPFDELYPQISHGFPSCKGQTFEQVDMRPGSVLFMPRGTWHYTEAEQDSLAISIVLSPPTQLDFFLYQLKSSLLQDSAWRSPCYGIGKMKGVDPGLYSKVSNTIYRLAKNHQNPNSPIRSFHQDSRYLVNPEVEVGITQKQGFHEIEYVGTNDEGLKGQVRMEVSAEIAAIFAWLQNRQKPFTVKQCMKKFPGVSHAQFVEFFSRARQTGLLQNLWFVAL